MYQRGGKRRTASRQQSRPPSQRTIRMRQETQRRAATGRRDRRPRYIYRRQNFQQDHPRRQRIRFRRSPPLYKAEGCVCSNYQPCDAMRRPRTAKGRCQACRRTCTKNYRRAQFCQDHAMSKQNTRSKKVTREGEQMESFASFSRAVLPSFYCSVGRDVGSWERGQSRWAGGSGDYYANYRDLRRYTAGEDICPDRLRQS